MFDRDVFDVDPVCGDIGEQLAQSTRSVGDLDDHRHDLLRALAAFAGQRTHPRVAPGQHVNHRARVVEGFDQLVQVGAQRNQLFSDRRDVGRHDLPPHGDVGGCDPGDVAHPLPGQPQVTSRYLGQPCGGQTAHQLRKMADFGNRTIMLAGVHLKQPRSAGVNERAGPIYHPGGIVGPGGQHPRPVDEQFADRSDRAAVLGTGHRVSTDIAAEVDVQLRQIGGDP